MRSSNSARSRTAALAAVLATMLATVLIGPSSAAAATQAASQCGGNLPFGRVVACPSIVDAAQDVYRFTTTSDNDLLYTMLTRSTGDGVSGTVTGPDGSSVCFVNSDSGTCQLGPAGKYKLTISLYYGVGTGNYSIAIESTLTPSSCKTLGSSFFSFASSGTGVSMPVGSAGKCLTFVQPQGSVLFGPRFFGDGSYFITGALYDAQNQPLCSIQYQNGCTLTSPGPYRLFVVEHYGAGLDVTMRMPRLSASAGCAAVKPGPFGDGATVFSGTAPLGWFGCNKLKAPAAGLVSIQFTPTDQGGFWNLYNDAGVQVCESYTNRNACPLPAAGNYTLLLTGGDVNTSPPAYTLGVTALYSNNGCAPVTSTSWDQDTLLVHQKSGVQLNCQLIKGNAGDRIITYRAPTVYNFVYADLVDSAGAIVCPGFSDQDGCVLPATGKYRVVSKLNSWDPQTTDAVYKLQPRRLSAPQGCGAAITTGAYNAAPAGALGGIRCRIMNIPAAGIYTLRAMDGQNYQTYTQVYDPSGIKLNCGTLWCEFPAAGTYTMVLNGSDVTSVIDNDFQYVVALLPQVPSGCPSVGTDTAHLTAYRSQFASAGQFDCVAIDAPSDAKVVMLRPGDAEGAGRPEGQVFDGNGNYICDSAYSLRQETCQLTGNGPFVFAYSAPEGAASGAYAMEFARVSGDSGCPVLAQSADGVTVTSSATTFSACFSIPADQHGARETFTYRRTAGTGDAELAVYDSNGVRYCGSLLFPSADRTFTCTLPAGAYTAILETDAVDAAYQVKHQTAP